jgi:hypothetical protein
MQQHPQLQLQPPIWQQFFLSEKLAPDPRPWQWDNWILAPVRDRAIGAFASCRSGGKKVTNPRNNGIDRGSQLMLPDTNDLPTGTPQAARDPVITKPIELHFGAPVARVRLNGSVRTSSATMPEATIGEDQKSFSWEGKIRLAQYADWSNFPSIQSSPNESHSETLLGRSIG